MCTEGNSRAPYPKGDVQKVAATVNVDSLNVEETLTEESLDEEELMLDIQQLAISPNEEVASVSVAQVVGEAPKEAWDILPLTIEEVATAT